MTKTSEPTAQEETDRNSEPTADATAAPKFISRLTAEHREIEAKLAAALEKPDDATAATQLAALWRRHNALESEAVQAVAMAGGDAAALAPLKAAQLLQDVITVLTETLATGAATEKLGRLQALGQVLTTAMQQEEAPGAGLYALLVASGAADLDERIERRASELTNEAVDAGTPVLHLLDLSAFAQQPRVKSETSTMARQSNSRERDENGRFVSDDDRRGGSYARRRDDDRDDDRGGNGNGNGNGRGWSGDPRGHAEASRRGWETRRREDDDDRRSSASSSSRSRYEDDTRGDDDRRRDDRGRFASDDNRSYGRSRRDDDDDGRGWFGDARGHAEASRRGWETRRREDDDDDRRSASASSRSRGGSPYDDDDDRRRDDRGRFMSDDDRGGGSRSGSSRRNDDDDDGRGWYGDPRGHAEAARRGWETRRGEDDDQDDRRSSSSSRSRSSGSSRYDDDDDRRRDDRGRFLSEDDRGGSRSSGSRRNDDEDTRRSRRRDDDDDDGRGWHGDPRGHAEAARRGWETRRG